MGFNDVLRGCKRTLGSVLLAGSLFLPMGCGDSGGGSTPTNHAPTITSLAGSTSAVAGQGYAHDVNATDSDGDTLTYYITNGPSTMTINSGNGNLSWTPDVADIGINHPVTVRASDGSKVADQSWNVFVSGSGDPTFTSSPQTDSIEGILYNYDADATDPENDPITYSLLTAPAGMTINPSTGVLNWTPSEAQERANHDVVISADDDFGGHSEQAYQVWPRGRENASGNVNALGSGTNLPNITVKVSEAVTGDYLTTTDGSGNWTLANIPDGDHPTTFSDGSATYETFKAGKLRVNGTSHKSGLQTRLALRADEAFMRDAGRMDMIPEDDDMLKRWEQKPVWDVYTLETDSGTPVNGTLVTGVKDAIKNELSQYTQNHFGAFTDTDINVIASLPPIGQPADGHVKVYWSNSISSGTNRSYFNGNEVLSARSSFNPSATKNVWLQELTENLIGSGETEDANYSDSVLYGWSVNTNYGINDNKLMDFHYGTYTLGTDTLWFRATGNADLGSADNHDVNPDGIIWNE